MNPAAAWAVAGLVLLLASAVFRLGERGLATIAGGLATGEWLALLVLTLLFAIGEGYFALARKWVPRTLARAAALRHEPRVLPRLLAPLHAMGLVALPAMTMLRNWAGVAAIALAVLIVRSLPEPWRGIIDFAVAAALAIGVVALLVRGRRVIRG